jgi:hypothetical protein
MAATAILLVLSSVRSSQSYFLFMTGYQNRSLGEMIGSQEVAAAIDSSRANLSLAESVSHWVAVSGGFTSSLGSIGNLSVCRSPFTVCRFVTISGSTYLLVISNENSGES